MKSAGEISKKELSDIRTLIKFVIIFCRKNHEETKSDFGLKGLDIRKVEKKRILLCPECTRLLTYGITMRLRCPHDPKPMCKKCENQCYHGPYKEKMRQVMKFSGIYLVTRGRVDMLYHYLR